jgi:hypothetical protein
MIKINLIPFLLVIIVSFFITGCQTGYHAQSATGGYNDIASKDPNIFITGFNGNGYTSGDRAYDLAKLRSAEKAWRRGYHYFAEIKSNTQINHTGNVNTATAVPMYGGGAFAIGSSTPIYAPSSGVSIIGFSKKPSQDSFKSGVTIYNTKDFIQSTASKYGAKIDLSITNPNGPVSDFEDFLFSNSADQDSLNVKEPIDKEDIFFLDLRNRNLSQNEAFLGQRYIRYSEFPYKNMGEAKPFLSKMAKNQNSNVVSIAPYTASGDDAKNFILQKGVLISFGIKRESMLGISFEPGLLKDKIYQVRSLTTVSSVFKLGDKILEIDGKDTLTIRNVIAELYYDKKPGEIVEVKVARNGEMKILSAPMLKL